MSFTNDKFSEEKKNVTAYLLGDFFKRVFLLGSTFRNDDLRLRISRIII